MLSQSSTVIADAPSSPPAAVLFAVNEVAAEVHPSHGRWVAFALALGALLLLGAWLRFYPSTGAASLGFDEHLYRRYVAQLSHYGPFAYPEIVATYAKLQAESPKAMLPPTRAAFLMGAWAWREVFGGTALEALRHISALGACGTLLIAAGLGARLGGRGWSLAAVALVGAAPLQIHLAQRALIDGFFSCWAMLALWALWECLQAGREEDAGAAAPSPSFARPGLRAWRWVYAGGLAMMVLTKQESAVFVWVALLILLALNRWGHFGKVPVRGERALWSATFLAPAAAVGVLVCLCGGPGELVGALQLYVRKSLTLVYAIQTGDGPWHRYLLDVLTVSPVVGLLALGGMFRARRGDRMGFYLLGFVVLTYALMCRLRYGMNLRYAAIWDVPLRLLALTQLAAWCENFRARRNLALALAVLALGGVEVWNYHRFFVEGAIYDPVPIELLHVLGILKG